MARKAQTARMFRGDNLYGVDVINADAKAVGRRLRTAVETKSWFMLGVAAVMALVKLAQEIAGISYTMRMAGQASAADEDQDEALDALSDVESPSLGAEESPL